MARDSIQALSAGVDKAKQVVIVGGIYRHYRSSDLLYKVLAIGIQEATEKICVVYQALYDDQLVWVRDLESWLEPVKGVDGQYIQRFFWVKE